MPFLASGSLPPVPSRERESGGEVPKTMETMTRFSSRLFPIAAAVKCLRIIPKGRFSPSHFLRPRSCPESEFQIPEQNRAFHGSFIGSKRHPPSTTASAGWFLGLGEKKPILPEIVKAGDPVLHEPAGEVAVSEIGSEKIQKIIEDMVAVMRKAPGVGLAAPQIGIPLRVLLLAFAEVKILVIC